MKDFNLSTKTTYVEVLEPLGQALPAMLKVMAPEWSQVKVPHLPFSQGLIQSV